MKCLALCLTGFVLLSSWECSRSLADDEMFVAGFDRFFTQADRASSVGGKLLLAELNCTACHNSTDKTLAPKEGPRLNSAAGRLQAEWVSRFLSHPSREKPGTTMPDVLHSLDEKTKATTIKALVAFLSTQDTALPTLVSNPLKPIALEFWNKGSAERGEDLYHQVGCVACHEPDKKRKGSQKPTQLEKLLAQLEPDEIKALGLSDAAKPVRSVPHAKLVKKYSRRSLTRFLIQPDLVRQHGRMPSLKLSPAEAADITAYLLQNQESSRLLADDKTLPANDKLVKLGMQLFSDLGCAACHETKSKLVPAARVLSKSLKEISVPVGNGKMPAQGCLSKPAARAPSFVLSQSQTNAILSALREAQQKDLEAPTAVTVQQKAERELEFKMLQLNCLACHERHKNGGVGVARRQFFETQDHIDLGDEGRIPPPLDHVGYKLKSTWLKTVLDGKGDVRPHLMARMPLFPSSMTRSLPTNFAAADRTFNSPTSQPPEFKNARKLSTEGRVLLNTGCVQCHPFRGERLPGVIGIDIASIDKRINPVWFQEFLLNPASLKNRTRMPTFFPNRRSSNQTVLQGNADQQIAAMWGYLNEPNKLPLPDKILAGKIHDFEVKPKERPVVLRTFMKDAGPHAIAVGFPLGVHFAFDAETVRLAQIWRGRFLDAHGTWYDRFTPLATPLGKNVITLPKLPPFAILDSPASPWPVASDSNTTYRFKGYRVDKSGTPTLLYDYRSFRISEQLKPAQDGRLKRTISFTTKASERDSAEPVSIWLLANSGDKLKADDGGFTNSQGLTVRVNSDPKNVAATGKTRVIKGQEQWIVPLKVRHGTSINLTYQW